MRAAARGRGSRTAARTADPWDRRLRGALIALDRVGRRRWLYPMLSAAAGAAVLLALAAAGGLPQPNVHDEFSYLLGADTLAAGRLANLPHPLWEFFETIHVISQPAYASKYQPGQALFLALGQVVFGHPYYGVVLENALLFGALCWMLQTWLAPAWALLGAALSVVSIAGGFYWGFSYWGGSAAALAGALLMTAAGKIARDLRMAYGWLAGAAAVLLFWTRPFEGGLLCAALAAGAAVWLRRQPAEVRRAALRVAVPSLAAVAAAGLAFQFLYNRAITGHGLELPYVLEYRQYHVVPLLWTGELGMPKTYRSEALRLQNAVWEPPAVAAIRRMTATERAAHLARRLLDAVYDIVPLGLWLPAAFLFWRDRRLRFLLLAGMAGGAALCLETWIYPHYVAPWFPLALLLGFATLRRVRGLRWRGRAAGVYLAAALVAAAFGSAALRAATEIHYILHPARLNVGRERARIADNLRARGGRHVILARYGPRHDVSQEWVYNGADIDGAAVVWARDRGAQENQRLLRYFTGRSFWLFEPDASPPALALYP